MEEDVVDDSDEASNALAEAIKKVILEKRDDDSERERTTREMVDRAVRDGE